MSQDHGHEDPMADQIRALFAAAAAHHVPRPDSPKAAGRPTHCDTSRPADALVAWSAVVHAADAFMCATTTPLWSGIHDDPWIAEVRADALYGMACMHALLGDRDAALCALDKVVRTGHAKFELLERDADLEGLRGDPAFAALVTEARLRVEGLTVEQVVERLGQPREKVQTDGSKLWVYYYDLVEVYFDADGVVDWTCLT